MQVLCLYEPRKSKPRVKSELRKQQLTVTLSDCNRLALLMVLWEIQKFICYCTVLLCFTLYLREISNYKPLRGLYLEGLIQRRVFCEFGGVIIGGAYTWGGLFSEFYDNLTESGST